MKFLIKNIFSLLPVLFFCTLALAQQQEEELFENSGPKENNKGNSLNLAEVAASIPNNVQVVFSGLLDFRFVYTGKNVNWQQGGRGLSRYGGIDPNPRDNEELGDRSSSNFKFPQASLVTELVKDGNTIGHLQLNYDDATDTKGGNGKMGIVEGFVASQFKFKTQHSIDTRLGVLIPPISLEHPDTAWSTVYSITPSAINTWVGEELRSLGLEMKYSYEFKPFSTFDILVAPYSNNDPAGSILSWRGWALHDYQYAIGARLKIQYVDPEKLAPRGYWITPWKELDGNIGYYTRMQLNIDHKYKISAYYQDSLADTEAIDNPDNEYGWRTRFTNLSLELHPTGNVTILSQGMVGNTRMGNPDNYGVNNDFDAWYLMISYAPSQHRFTARYDYFRVLDKDSLFSTDKNTQVGSAQTYAYMLRIGDFHVLGAEYLRIVSRREGSQNYDPDQDPKDDQWQLMYRLLF